MPSNALKMSQLVAEIQALMEKHGDLDVVLALPGENAVIAVDGANMVIGAELPWQKLAEPALILGMTARTSGKVVNMPGMVYRSVPTSSEWSYERKAAPEGELVTVWRRHGGESVGKRVGDMWYVENGDRRGMVEIIPAGILAWRPL